MAIEFVESRVREIVAEQLGLGEEEIMPGASFSNDLGVDTLDFIELVMAFEEEFEVDIDDEDAESLNTVQDVIDFLSSRTQ